MESNEMRMENCKGCHYSSSGCVCLLTNRKINTLNKCPCGICLVKMICRLGCEEFTIFYKAEVERYILTKSYNGK